MGIVSDYFVVEKAGTYKIFANFIVCTHEAHCDATVWLKANGTVIMTKQIEGHCFVDTDNQVYTQFCVETTMPLNSVVGEEVWFELDMDEDDYMTVRESSLESELTTPHELSGWTVEEDEVLENEYSDTIFFYDDGHAADRNIKMSEIELTAGGGLTLQLDPTPCETVLNIDPDSNEMQFFANGKRVVTLNTKTGGVTLDPEFDYETGAMNFWRAVAVAFPQMFPEQPKMDIEITHVEAESRPLGIVWDSTDPAENYDRAMEMFKNG